MVSSTVLHRCSIHGSRNARVGLLNKFDKFNEGSYEGFALGVVITM